MRGVLAPPLGVQGHAGPPGAEVPGDVIPATACRIFPVVWRHSPPQRAGERMGRSHGAQKIKITLTINNSLNGADLIQSMPGEPFYLNRVPTLSLHLLLSSVSLWGMVSSLIYPPLPARHHRRQRDAQGSDGHPG